MWMAVRVFAWAFAGAFVGAAFLGWAAGIICFFIAGCLALSFDD